MTTAHGDHNHVLARAAAAVGRVVRGKDAQVRLALACFLARGRLLLTDLPGVGKTTLSPPPLGADQVDDFLFAARRGYCGH